MNPVDGAIGGLDRRDVLKKTALVGGIAWAAPVVTATSAWASNGVCTPGCFPTGAVTLVDITGVKAGCAPGEAPGQQDYVLDFTAIYTSTLECPCSETPPGFGSGSITAQATIPDPGNNPFTTQVLFVFGFCQDDTGDFIEYRCTVSVSGEVTGNCQPQTGTLRVTGFSAASCESVCLA